MNERKPHDRLRPSRQHAGHPRAARDRAQRKELADRGAAPDADEQPRPRRGRAAGRTRRLWRHRARGARLAGLRRDRRDAAPSRTGRDAARPVGQAGRRLSHPCRRAARADRQLEPRAALGDLGPFPRARSQGPDDVRPDDRGLLDLYRLAGHRAGHLRDLRRDGPPALWRRPFGQMDPDRRPGRHGRRAAALGDDGRGVDAGRRMPPLQHRFPPEDRLRRRRRQRPRRRACDHRQGDEGAESRLGRAARQCGRDRARARAARRQARRRHRPDLRARSGQRLSAERLDAAAVGRAARERSEGRRARRQGLDGRACARDARLLSRGRADRRLRQQHPPDGARRRGQGRLRFSGLRAGLYPAAVLPRRSARSAGSRSRAIRRTSSRPTRR